MPVLSAAGRLGGKPLLVLGLSGENVARLYAAEPIIVDAAELGLPALQVMLLAGRDEHTLLQQLRSHGLVPACCPAHSATCAPPAQLCCAHCPETTHPDHAPGVRCVLDRPRSAPHD
jgi:hypothetical protein